MGQPKFTRWQDEKRYIELLNKKKSNQQMTQSEDEELAKLEQTGNLVQGGEGVGNQYNKDESQVEGVDDNSDTKHGQTPFKAQFDENKTEEEKKAEQDRSAENKPGNKAKAK